LIATLPCLISNGSLPRETEGVATSPLSAQEAKEALVEMVRANQDDRTHMHKINPDELATVIPEHDNGHCRIGRFRVDLNQRTYQISFVGACSFHYVGTFARQSGRWVASPPQIESIDCWMPGPPQ
jgi:hypothetical protein